MTVIHDSAPLGAQDLAPQDLALIGRQIGSGLQTLYEPVVCESLLDSMAGLIERIAAQEARRGEPDRDTALAPLRG